MTKIKSTKKALIASLLSLAMCFTMLVGSTFAWFTDTATTAVNTIQAGTLDISLVDADGDSLEGRTIDFVKAAGAEDEAILWEPGCAYKLPEVYIKNNGNLALKYQIVISGINGDAKLNEAIEWTIKLDGEDLADEYFLAAGETSKALTISGRMKEDAGNEYQGLTIEGIAITVLATQDTVESDSNDNEYDKDSYYYIDVDGTIVIENAAALMGFAADVNNGVSTFAGKTVKLTSDIDMKDYAWTPIGGLESYPSVTFAGTFDGQGHTISNLTSVDLIDNYACAGLFGTTTGIIKNVILDNADITSSHYAGGIVGYSSANGMKIENCKVTNSTITAIPEMFKDDNGFVTYDNGDKAGGIIGYMVAGDVVTGCVVENTTINAYRDMGGIVGYSAGNVTNNTVKNVTININRDVTVNYKDYTDKEEHDAGSIIGENQGTESNNAGYAQVFPIESNADLAAAWKATDSLTLPADTKIIGDTLVVASNKNLTTDGGTYDSRGYDPAFNVEAGATATFNGGTYMTSGQQIINSQSVGSTVTINDGYYDGSCLVWNGGVSEIVINGGSFDLWCITVVDTATTSTMTINGGNFTLYSGKDNSYNGFTAGTEAPLVIKGGTFNQDPSDYVDTSAYDITLADGWYTVTAK